MIRCYFFLEEEIKSAVFSGDEREILIDFYKNNPPLWNHRMEEYWNRDLRQALLNKLMGEFEEKFTTEEIKKRVPQYFLFLKGNVKVKKHQKVLV